MPLSHAILGFLDYQPMSGYDLKKYFDQSVAHFWSATQSHIYKALENLENDGMVESELIPPSGLRWVKAAMIGVDPGPATLSSIGTRLMSPTSCRSRSLVSASIANTASRSPGWVILSNSETGGKREDTMR